MVLYKCIIIIIFFSPLAQSRRHDNIEVREMCNGCNGVSLGDHGVPEGNRIPSLKSHGKALEQEGGFPGVFCDCSDASANLFVSAVLPSHATHQLFPRQRDRRHASCSVQHTCLSSSVPMSGLIFYYYY